MCWSFPIKVAWNRSRGFHRSNNIIILWKEKEKERERERESEKSVREKERIRYRYKRVDKGNGQSENINNHEHVEYAVYLLTRDHVTDYFLALPSFTSDSLKITDIIGILTNVVRIAQVLKFRMIWCFCFPPNSLKNKNINPIHDISTLWIQFGKSSIWVVLTKIFFSREALLFWRDRIGKEGWTGRRTYLLCRLGDWSTMV